MSVNVSVIMPVYNAREYLRDSMDSLLLQTLRDIEIICVDDGSKDESPEILEEYARRDSRVRVIRQENGGAGAARNHGLKYAVGEYLSIVDCDDFFAPDMLEKSYREAKTKNLDMVVFRCDLYDNNTDSYRSADYTIRRKLLPEKDVFCAEDVKQDVFKLFVGWSWDKLFRTSFVREHGMLFQEQRTTNDMLFVFNGLIRAKRIGVMEDVLIHHRRGVESLSVTREKSWMCFYNALKALKEEMVAAGCYDRFEQDYKNYCVHFSFWNLNSLKEPTFTLLYNKLREEWFAEMGVVDCPAGYFYNQQEYRALRNVCDHDVQWYKAEMAFSSDADAGMGAKILGSLKYYGVGHTLALVWRKVVFLVTGKEIF